MTVHVPLEPYMVDKHTDGPDVSRKRELDARGVLTEYEADLACRFQDGGDYDSYRIATGETFVEIVCGGYMNGYSPVRCYEAFTAVQLFIDAMERYFATIPHGKTIHWRAHPQWQSYSVEERDHWVDPCVAVESSGYKSRTVRVIYSIYARLVLI